MIFLSLCQDQYYHFSLGHETNQGVLNCALVFLRSQCLVSFSYSIYGKVILF